MSEYDYGNARVRAMKSRLLSREELEALAESRSISDLISSLTETAYRQSVEFAVVRATGLAAIGEAIRHNLAETVGKVRTFYEGDAGELVMVWLRGYDVHNLKTVLRGISQNVSPDEINEALIPIGELSRAVFAELIRAAEPRTAIDMLATMRFPIAQPLVALRSEHPGASVLEMEFVLNRWYFHEAQAAVGCHGVPVLASALDLEADLVNLMTVLRFAHQPTERAILRDQLKIDDLSTLFVGPGSLSFATLDRAGQQESVESAIETLGTTQYHRPLQAGLEDYRESRRLSDLEKHLNRYRLRRVAKLTITDPLGIGVPLAYSGLKLNEIGNIRWIAGGVNLGLDNGVIKNELEIIG